MRSRHGIDCNQVTVIFREGNCNYLTDEIDLLGYSCCLNLNYVFLLTQLCIFILMIHNEVAVRYFGGLARWGL